MGMQEVAIKLNLDSSSFVSSAQNVADAFGKINEKLAEASKAGNTEDIERYTKMAANLQHMYNGMAAGGGGSGGGGGGGGSGGDGDDAKRKTDAVQAANTVGKGLNSSARQAGSGDGLGAAITGAQAGMDVVASMGDKAAKVMGIAGSFLLPMMLGNTLTSFYEQQMEGAMGVSALLNPTEQDFINKDSERFKNGRFNWYNYTQDANGNLLEKEEIRKDINTSNIQEAFDKAAKAATDLGYSMEEGMALVKNATQYGFTESNVYDAERSVFSWASVSSIEPETLMKYKGSRYRYGDDSDNSLAAAFGINDKMGMEKGQYRETLQSLQQIFEDGIAKGFVKGTAEIGSTLVGLYEASGKSKLWQGEQGAQRYMQMNNAIAGATSLGSVTDILAYRAASALSPETKKQARENADIKGSYGYIDTMIALEQGMSGEMLGNLRKQVEGIAGAGNKEGQIEYYKNLFGFNYSGGAKIYEMMQNKTDMNAIADEIKKMKEDPKNLSEQKSALKATEEIRTSVAKMGENLMWIKTKINEGVAGIAKIASGELSPIELIVSKIKELLTGKEMTDAMTKSISGALGSSAIDVFKIPGR